MHGQLRSPLLQWNARWDDDKWPLDVQHFGRGLSDNDVSVVVEARNALCTLTRKPRGIFVRGRPLPANPAESLPDAASADQKKRAIATWQRDVRENWRSWYFRFRRYRDRDDLDQLIFSTRKDNDR